uniref:Reverse transcriptase domain-containing protein n=1 Tax=Oryzias melastigma TaxID=30732 RepID=A0A3B3C6W3_ORYME
MKGGVVRFGNSEARFGSSYGAVSLASGSTAALTFEQQKELLLIQLEIERERTWAERPCVLTGKAQQAFSALVGAESASYSTVKSAIMKAYELVPEAYRQRFRGCRRGDQTHLEFMRDLVRHFDSWCLSVSVNTFEGLRELMLLEQFKVSVPACVSTYVGDRGVKSVAEAAAPANDYHLTHSSTARSGPGRGSSDRSPNMGRRGRREHDVCNYCHRYGLEKVPVSVVGGGDLVRVKILCDTGALDSFIVSSTLPFSETFAGSNIPVVGLSLDVLHVPQHRFMLSCGFFQGVVSMGVRPALPVDGVHIILGTDIAGGKVRADLSPIGSVTCASSAGTCRGGGRWVLGHLPLCPLMPKVPFCQCSFFFIIIFFVNMSGRKPLLGGKAPGVDEVRPDSLKSLDAVGVSWLTRLCSIAWQTGTVPVDWQTGVVVPLFKKGDRRVCSNYRGITLLSLPGKVYARVLERRVHSIVKPQIQDKQCGFRPGRGTVDQLYTLFSVLEGSWEFAHPVHMCFVDLEKAFDRVPRCVLVEGALGVWGPGSPTQGCPVSVRPEQELGSHGRQ